MFHEMYAKKVLHFWLGYIRTMMQFPVLDLIFCLTEQEWVSETRVICPYKAWPIYEVHRITSLHEWNIRIYQWDWLEIKFNDIKAFPSVWQDILQGLQAILAFILVWWRLLRSGTIAHLKMFRSWCRNFSATDNWELGTFQHISDGFAAAHACRGA